MTMQLTRDAVPAGLSRPCISAHRIPARHAAQADEVFRADLATEMTLRVSAADPTRTQPKYNSLDREDRCQILLLLHPNTFRNISPAEEGAPEET